MAWRADRRSVVLLTMCVGMFLVLLDVTIVNVALPAIRADLRAGPAALEWIVDADTLGFACLMLSSGTLGDLYGRRRAAVAGLVTFGVGSVGCALAPGAGLLIAARGVQGVGGALLLPQTLAIITTVFPEPAERTRAIGIWAAISSLALPAGPLLGGILVDRFGWPSVFWVNIPLVAIATVVTLLAVEESRRPEERHLDLRGQVLVIVGLTALTGALIEAVRFGFLAPIVLSGIAVGVAALASFVAAERRNPAPMLPLALFRHAGFRTANAVGLLMNFGGVGILYQLTLYLQVVQGRSALAAGVLLVPFTAPLIVVAPLAARLATRVGPRVPMVGGMLMAAAGVLLLAGVSRDGGLGLVVPAGVLGGIGLALNTTPMVGVAMSALPTARAGIAAGANNTARQIGSALGVAVLGAVAGDPATPGYISGLHAAALMTAAAWALAAAWAFAGIPGKARASGEPVTSLVE